MSDIIRIALEGSQVIKIPKSVLTSKSIVFRAMLESRMTEKLTRSIDIKDVEVEVFREVIHYLHTGCCPYLSKFPWKLLACADKYQIGGLLAKCDKFFNQTVTDMNAAETLELAVFYNRKDLKRKLMYYISRRIQDVANTPGWAMISGDFTLMTELALIMSKRNRERMCNLVELERSDSSITMFWALDAFRWGSQPKRVTSPKFDMIVGGETLEFFFVIFTGEETAGNYLFLITISTKTFKTPLRLSGDFHHFGRDFRQSCRSRPITWNATDVKLSPDSISRQKLVLSVPESYFCKLNRSRIETVFQFSLSTCTCKTFHTLDKKHVHFAPGRSLIPSTHPDNAVELYIAGHNSGDHKLKFRAKNLIRAQTKTIIESPSWKLLSGFPDLITELLLAL